MTRASDLVREHYPEFNKALDDIKAKFGAIKLEHVKCGVGEWGKKFEGEEVNPVLSEKEILNRVQLSKKYRGK